MLTQNSVTENICISLYVNNHRCFICVVNSECANINE